MDKPTIEIIQNLGLTSSFIGPTTGRANTVFLGETKQAHVIIPHNNLFGSLSQPLVANIGMRNLQMQGKST